jgi:hypothetical protein
MAFVYLYGAAAQAKTVGNLLGRHAVGAQLDDFYFACRKVGLCADAVLLAFVAALDAKQGVDEVFGDIRKLLEGLC